MKRFRPYFKLIKPVRGRFILGILAGGIASFASGFGLPFMTKEVFPLIFRGEDTGEVLAAPGWMESVASMFGLELGNPDLIVKVACCMLPVVFLIRGIGTYLNIYLMNFAGMKVLEGIRLQVFERLQYLSLAFHQKHKEGDLLNRVMGDTQQMQNVLIRVSNDLVIQPLTLVSAMAFLAWSAWTDSKVFFILIALASMPVCILPIRWVGQKLLKKAKSLQKEAGNITAAVSESLASQREVRAYNMQDQQVATVAGMSARFIGFRMNVVKYKQMVSPLVEIVAAIAISIAIYYGARDGMTLQSFLALVMALYLAYEPVKKLGGVHALLKQGEASLDRLEEILLSEDEVKSSDQKTSIPNVRGDLSVADADFSYTGPDELVLHDISVHIEAGQTVALVGPSGAGKSTFVSLIPRFYDVQRGEVRVDGIDVSQVSKRELREQIALVSQHPLLFRGTLADNIAIGKPGASRDEIIDSAKKAHAHDFIMDQPDGYDTAVGERGEGLSGGQRQRIAIARAFLKDAPILILDEATSALDTESESQIQEQLKELSEGRTTLQIAHRFSSIRDAERILVFAPTEKGGEIIADGSHEELYASCELYKDLYDRQSG
ncbi:MAG: ABC transporter ATP-binding protein [Akkermansiaceae bacterium]